MGQAFFLVSITLTIPAIVQGYYLFWDLCELWTLHGDNCGQTKEDIEKYPQINVIRDEPIYDITTWFNFTKKKNFPKVEICANYLSGRVISDEIDEYAKYVDCD